MSIVRNPDGQVIKEKYERQGWPAIKRPDLKPPDGWDTSLIPAVNRVRNHQLSPDGEQIAFIWDREDQSDVYVMPTAGGWPRRISTQRAATAYWADEVPQWSPDGRFLLFTHRPFDDMNRLDLWLVEIETGQVRQLTNTPKLRNWGGIWSPDDTFLTFEYEDPLLPPDLYKVEVANGRTTQLTFSNLPALAANPLVVPELVSYKSSDGLEIPAFLYRPAQSNGAAVVYPHGGPSSLYTFAWDIWAQYFVAKGYTWLAPNYRGSTGYGVTFEHANYNDWGVGDTQDCLAGARYLHRFAEIDPERIGIFGSSYGGYMAACCLSRDPDYLFACGVSKYGDANVLSSWAQCNRDLRLYTEIFLGHPAVNRPVHLAASPIAEVENVQKPVLIAHGLDDTVVPPQSSEEWVEALRRAGKTFEYKTYAGEAHGFLHKKTVLDFYGRMETFL